MQGFTLFAFAKHLAFVFLPKYNFFRMKNGFPVFLLYY